MASARSALLAACASLAALGAPSTPGAFPVIYTVSTPERGAQLAAWLGEGEWCHVVLPTARPQDYRVDFAAPGNASSGLRIADPRGRPLLAFGAPLSARAQRGLVDSHKIASAGFHLAAVGCVATRCHACLRDAAHEFAAVLEDDVAWVPGHSPGGSAARFPLLLRAATERVRARAAPGAASKLQLAVSTRGGGRCEPGAPLPGWPDARLAQCARFADAKAYAISVALARRVARAHAQLLAGDRGCANPWNHPSCGRDPALVRAFFEQCERRPAAPSEGCSGVALASAAHAWALRDDRSLPRHRNHTHFEEIERAAKAALEATRESRAAARLERAGAPTGGPG